MKKLVTKIIASFEIKEGGFSARKLSTFYAIMVAGLITIWKVPDADMLMALIAWLIFALLCLSVITAEQLIKFKNGDGKSSASEKSGEDSAGAVN